METGDTGDARDPTQGKIHKKRHRVSKKSSEEKFHKFVLGKSREDLIGIIESLKDKYSRVKSELEETINGRKQLEVSIESYDFKLAKLKDKIYKLQDDLCHKDDIIRELEENMGASGWNPEAKAKQQVDVCVGTESCYTGDGRVEEARKRTGATKEIENELQKVIDDMTDEGMLQQSQIDELNQQLDERDNTVEDLEKQIQDLQFLLDEEKKKNCYSLSPNDQAQEKIDQLMIEKERLQTRIEELENYIQATNEPEPTIPVEDIEGVSPRSANSALRILKTQYLRLSKEHSAVTKEKSLLQEENDLLRSEIRKNFMSDDECSNYSNSLDGSEDFDCEGHFSLKNESNNQSSGEPLPPSGTVMQKATPVPSPVTSPRDQPQQPQVQAPTYNAPQQQQVQAPPNRAVGANNVQNYASRPSVAGSDLVSSDSSGIFSGEEVTSRSSVVTSSTVSPRSSAVTSCGTVSPGSSRVTSCNEISLRSSGITSCNEVTSCDAVSPRSSAVTSCDTVSPKSSAITSCDAVSPRSSAASCDDVSPMSSRVTSGNEISLRSSGITSCDEVSPNPSAVVSGDVVEHLQQQHVQQVATLGNELMQYRHEIEKLMQVNQSLSIENHSMPEYRRMAQVVQEANCNLDRKINALSMNLHTTSKEKAELELKLQEMQKQVKMEENNRVFITREPMENQPESPKNETFHRISTQKVRVEREVQTEVLPKAQQQQPNFERQKGAANSTFQQTRELRKLMPQSDGDSCGTPRANKVIALVKLHEKILEEKEEAAQKPGKKFPHWPSRKEPIDITREFSEPYKSRGVLKGAVQSSPELTVQPPSSAPTTNHAKSESNMHERSRYACQGSFNDVVQAFSMLKTSAEQMELVNENLNREIATIRMTYESQLNYCKAQSDRSEMLNVSLHDKCEKLVQQLENDRRYAYELDCSYRELVRQMDQDQARLNEDNVKQRKELQSLQKEMTQMKQTVQEVQGDRSSVELNFKQELETREGHIQGLLAHNTKLRNEANELADKVKQQDNEISYLYKSLQGYAQMEITAAVGGHAPAKLARDREREQRDQDYAAAREERESRERDYAAARDRERDYNAREARRADRIRNINGRESQVEISMRQSDASPEGDIRYFSPIPARFAKIAEEQRTV